MGSPCHILLYPPLAGKVAADVNNNISGFHTAGAGRGNVIVPAFIVFIVVAFCYEINIDLCCAQGKQRFLSEVSPGLVGRRVGRKHFLRPEAMRKRGCGRNAVESLLADSGMVNRLL